MTREQVVLLWIPLGGALLYLMGEQEHSEATPSLVVVPSTRPVVKEEQFLTYNNDEIYSNFLQGEQHLRSLTGQKNIEVMKGEASCAVKHMVLIEGHADEAISHSADVGKSPAQYNTLEQKVRETRHNFQDGKISVEQALVQIRDARRYFESFNPQFDISQCKACKVE